MASKKLFNVGYSVRLFDGRMLQGQIVLLATSVTNLSKVAKQWMTSFQPWLYADGDRAQPTNIAVNKGVQILEFIGFSEGNFTNS